MNEPRTAIALLRFDDPEPAVGTEVMRFGWRFVRTEAGWMNQSDRRYRRPLAWRALFDWCSGGLGSDFVAVVAWPERIAS